MSERTFTLHICGCDNRLWTSNDAGMECWLCNTKVRAVTAYANDRPDNDPAPQVSPRQETLL